MIVNGSHRINHAPIIGPTHEALSLHGRMYRGVNVLYVGSRDKSFRELNELKKNKKKKNPDD